MKEINEAFDAMFKELQKTGDAYDYPSAARSVIEECKQVVQSRLEVLEKENASLKRDAERWNEVANGASPFLGIIYVDDFGNERWLMGCEAEKAVDSAIQDNKETSA